VAKGKAEKSKKTRYRKAQPKVLSATPDSPFFNAPTSPKEMVEGFSADPGTCVLWRQRQFRPRVWLAVADWSGQPPTNLRPNTQLGALVPLWGIGAQNNLVQVTNMHQVFTPFPSLMAPPNVLLAADTTIAQWEAIVWTFQNPRTPCWGTP
jgi:hypothetical protein